MSYYEIFSKIVEYKNVKRNNAVTIESRIAVSTTRAVTVVSSITRLQRVRFTFLHAKIRRVNGRTFSVYFEKLPPRPTRQRNVAKSSLRNAKNARRQRSVTVIGRHYDGAEKTRNSQKSEKLENEGKNREKEKIRTHVFRLDVTSLRLHRRRRRRRRRWLSPRVSGRVVSLRARPSRTEKQRRQTRWLSSSGRARVHPLSRLLRAL